MTENNQSPEIKMRRGISWSPDDERLATWIAERTDGGNVSRLLRRLVRVEAARYEDAPTRSDNRQPEPVAA